MFKAYKPDIPLALAQQQLGFYDNKKECVKYLTEICVKMKGNSIDVKSVIDN